MPMVLTTSQISIFDYNDALTLTGFITANQPKTQQYDPPTERFVPDWTETPLTLTASLYKTGSTNDIIDSADVIKIEWFDASNPSTPLSSGGAYTVNGKTLTVSQNVLKDRSSVDFICEIVFRDGASGMDLLHKMSVSFSKVLNGSSAASVVAWLPEGNVFKNDEIDTLIAEADLWRGGVIDTDVTYQWYKQDPTVQVDQGGGIGWLKLTADNNDGETGYTTRQLTIPADAVPSSEAYKIVITDSSGNKYQDTVTVVDHSDPLQVIIISTGGNVFKNGVGTTELTAQLFQGDEEVDVNGTKYVYKWYKYDQNGNIDPSFNKTGKTITVNSSDVVNKATFVCEIE